MNPWVVRGQKIPEFERLDELRELQREYTLYQKMKRRLEKALEEEELDKEKEVKEEVRESEEEEFSLKENEERGVGALLLS